MRPHVLLLIASLLFVTAATAAPAATDYLIITTDELAPEFSDLVVHKTSLGFEPAVISVESIVAMSLPGRDLPEQIRAYIQSVEALGSLRFVLIGGDTGQVPARQVISEFYPVAGASRPTDLYYAALEGDWDANANDVFGEAGVDDADLGPEIAIGRAPVRAPAEAAQFVAKVVAYENPANTGHRNSAAYLSEVLFPSQWQPPAVIQLDGGTFSEELATQSGGGSPALVSDRLYENHAAYPGALALTKAGAVASMDSGDHGFVVHTGHGWQTSLSMGDGQLESADALALTNGPAFFVLMSSVGEAASFDVDPVLEEFIRNPAGGAVALLGQSRTSFPAVTQAYSVAVHDQLFAHGAASLGEAMATVMTDRLADVQTNDAERHAQLSLTLLGDPSVAVGDLAAATSTPPAAEATIRSVAVRPNPFNPRTTVHFNLDARAAGAVTVAIFDPAGRRVRTLWSGPLDEGPHAMIWDGRGDDGGGLASGVYYASIEVGSERRAEKMVLLK